ncbi:MAG TPA: stage II sporulation protein P [Bacillota bacterium]|nr:stage II sporulation protein P [Bacillota bacterium]
MRKNLNRIIILSLLLVISLPYVANADDWYEPDPGYFTLLDEEGEELTVMAREVHPEDEYISGDNKHYKVTRVDKDKRQAHLEYQGEVSLTASLAEQASTATAKEQNGSIVMYATHNSESYLPSDGEQSTDGGGGILDVADALRSNLDEKGIKAVMDKTAHDPHDAGAYRRSRQTATKLIQNNMPITAVFDIHRDAVPKSHYATKVDGKDMTMVRMVIGRRNQNRQANEELAKKLKSVADDTYPGLIKDIFVGRGTYNQELSPRSILFEFGTYESTKEAAKESSSYLAEVISKAMYGGNVKKHDQEDGKTKLDQEAKVTPIDQERSSGGGRGVLWIVIAVVVGGLGFLFISTGGREMVSKIKKSTGQEFSSFLGRKNKRKK